jgi:hypothetical protein
MTLIETAAAPQAENRRKKAAWRPMAAAAAAGSVLLITGFGVYATLNATATGATKVDAGTLKLTLADAGAGFTQDITKIAPTDAVNRFVTLTNSGNLEGKALNVKIASTAGANGNTALISDGAGNTTKALRISISSCSQAWTVAANASNCGGTVKALLTDTVLSTMANAQTLDVGAIAADTGNVFLKITATLPDQTETTVNGVAPAATVQGASASLAYTFTETQRDAKVTTS